MYAFNWETPLFGGKLKSPHALDVPFTFDTLDLTNATDRSPAAHRLAAAMSGTWTAFAQPAGPSIGDPVLAGLQPDRRATMILDTECRIANDPGGETRLLWKAITGT